MPKIAAPRNVGLPPPIGHAQTWTASTPGPEGAPRSIAHPATWNPALDTLLALPDVSMVIKGAETGTTGRGGGPTVFRLFTSSAPTDPHPLEWATSHVRVLERT